MMSTEGLPSFASFSFLSLSSAFSRSICFSVKSMADAAVKISSISIPQNLSISFIIVFVGPSGSTSRTFPLSESLAMNLGNVSSKSRPEQTGRGTTMRKVVPLPSVLLTHSMVPHMALTILLVMASPRPVPPLLLMCFEGSCEKGLKSRSCCSKGIPSPLSQTSRHTNAESAGASSCSRTDRITCPPSSLQNFTALSQRLIRHWRRRKLSPSKNGQVPSLQLKHSWTAKSTCFPLTRAAMISLSSSLSSPRWKGFSVKSMEEGIISCLLDWLPSSDPSAFASSFAYSSTWLIMPSRASAEVREDFTYSRWRGSSSSASRRSELKAMTELRGVRSSWLMLATKRRERRAEVSASTHAICSARFITSARTTAVCFESRSDLSCATRSVATVSSRQKFPDMSATE
mmetsp:Transcript_50628/g.158169  ORF Transcript_50628/g.158169 Transcript_50628/m.158169 type:complete len:402 (+) Transcript_50628:3042-4247(+)